MSRLRVRFIFLTSLDHISALYSSLFLLLYASLSLPSLHTMACQVSHVVTQKFHLWLNTGVPILHKPLLYKASNLFSVENANTSQYRNLN